MVIEAAYLGIPTFAFDIEHGPKEAIEMVGGCLIKGGTAEALADAIERFLDEPMSYCDLNSNSPALIREHLSSAGTSERIRDNLLALL